MPCPALLAPPLPVPCGGGEATRYAVALLAALDVETTLAPAGRPDPTPQAAWAASGAMALTGAPEGPPQQAPCPVAACADGAGRALDALAERLLDRAPLSVPGSMLLGERAALTRPPLRRRGRVSAGGSARLVRCADGWLALNLARPDDRLLLPAWLESSDPHAILPALPRDEDDPDATWAGVERICAARRRDPLVARARLMGMAVSPAELTAGGGPACWHRTSRLGPDRAVPRPGARPVVLDLSALWAGPLCGQLLAAAGARVIKVESLERPDGARDGSRPFFDRMNGEKQSVALAFRDAAGRRALAELVERADVVIEASRPRALAQLGLDAEKAVSRSGVTWIRITGHGARPPAADWVAFGDDAAAAAGLLVRSPNGDPAFCGDAIADPLTGLHAALAGLAAWARGGGRLVELSLVGVAAWVRHVEASASGVPRPPPVARPPRARPVRGHAPALGSDTKGVLAELGISC